MMKIVKCGKKFKISHKKSLFGKAEFLKIKKWKINEEMEDLIFQSQDNAQRYINYDWRALKEEDFIHASKTQLEAIFEQFHINPNYYSWADLWCGKQNWAIALSQILDKEVLAIDQDEDSYGKPFYHDDKVKFLELNTSKESIPKEITAVFIRSTIGISSIETIIKLNPQIELFIIIPEGINDNTGFSFKVEVNLLNEHFSDVKRMDINSDIGIKGASSSLIVFNRYFPVIIAMK